MVVAFIRLQLESGSASNGADRVTPFEPIRGDDEDDFGAEGFSFDRES